MEAMGLEPLRLLDPQILLKTVSYGNFIKQFAIYFTWGLSRISKGDSRELITGRNQGTVNWTMNGNEQSRVEFIPKLLHAACETLARRINSWLKERLGPNEFITIRQGH